MTLICITVPHSAIIARRHLYMCSVADIRNRLSNASWMYHLWSACLLIYSPVSLTSLNRFVKGRIVAGLKELDVTAGQDWLLLQQDFNVAAAPRTVGRRLEVRVPQKTGYC